jgi:hypothetical protein
VRGSRKHVLDWTSHPEFLRQLKDLLRPVEVQFPEDAEWMPRGHTAPQEARLESFGPRAYPESPVWPKLESWWLRHTAGANTPNWDIALACRIEGTPGLVLVEAKANVPELSDAAKSLASNASANSQENHQRITAALAEASEALGGASSGVRLSVAHSYQLSNRLAFAWRLASWGLPVALVYLGFTGDEEIRSVGEPLRDNAHWNEVFASHLEAVAPRAWVNQRLTTDSSPFWVLARSMPVSSIGATAT